MYIGPVQPGHCTLVAGQVHAGQYEAAAAYFADRFATADDEAGCVLAQEVEQARLRTGRLLPTTPIKMFSGLCFSKLKISHTESVLHHLLGTNLHCYFQ